MLAPPVPPTQIVPMPRPRVQVVPQIPCSEETTLENWLGFNFERQGGGRPASSGRPLSAREEAAHDLLEGVRLLLAEETLGEIWSGCLRSRQPLDLLIENWQSVLLVG